MRIDELRRYRNTRLYRPLARILRVYDRRLVDDLHARGFTAFSPAFPRILSNLDTEGTRIGVLAARAGVTRQAAGQLVAEIERAGYVERRASRDDARATIVRFTPEGRELLGHVLAFVERFERDLSALVGAPDFDVARAALSRIADAIDPDGAFGAADEPAAAPPPTRSSGRARGAGLRGRQ